MLSASSLFSDLDVEVATDAPVGATMTWYGIGGRADLLVRPRGVEALTTLLRRCNRSGTALRVLGSGANLLVADEGVDGIVVKLDAPAFAAVRYNPEGDVHAMRAMAGADLARVIMDTARRGLEGLSHLAGIPATIGGAVRMNAGGAFGDIGSAVRSVTCLSSAGEQVTYAAPELRFDYRSTNIPDPVILWAVLGLAPGDPVALRARVKEVFAFKKSTQPLADHSAGCAFKNPWDPTLERRVPAGRLIDEAGLKGLTIGGAAVSRHHANFIVVQPGATAADVLALMDEVRRRVFDHAGLELEREVVVWRRGD
jgi:UDP-N-acetylmuramate dehydrogenase